MESVGRQRSCCWAWWPRCSSVWLCWWRSGRHSARSRAISARRIWRRCRRRSRCGMPIRGCSSSGPRGLTLAAYLALARERALRAGRAQRRDAASGGRELPGRVVRAHAGEGGRPRRGDGARGASGSGRCRCGRARRPSWRRRPTRSSAARRTGSGGGYDGPLAYRMGKAMRPDVAAAFDRMAAAARRDGLALSITSAFRSDAEQARLFAANPNPKWVAPPGTSLHRYATELDLGPPAAYAWLAANARRVRLHPPLRVGALALRLRREPARPRAPGAVRARLVGAAGRRPRPDPPPACRPSCRRASTIRSPRRRCAGTCRWSCWPRSSTRSPASTRSRESPAGARGIAQFMPGTARAYGLADPYDPVAAIDAQAHLMSDLLRQLRRQGRAGAGGLQRGPGRGRALRRRAAVRGDARLRGAHPRPAGRGRRARRSARPSR